MPRTLGRGKTQLFFLPPEDMMNHQTPFLTQDLVAMALEKSAQHVRLHTEGQRLAGEKVASAQVSDEEESYPTERVEKLASAIEEIIPVLNEKEAGFVDSVGHAVGRGATHLGDAAAAVATRSGRLAGVGKSIADGAIKVQNMSNSTLGKGALAIGGGLAAAGAGGALAHKALSSEKRASIADKLKGVGSKIMSKAKRTGEILTGSKADDLERRAGKAVSRTSEILKGQAGDTAAQVAKKDTVRGNAATFARLRGAEAATERTKSRAAQAGVAGLGLAGVGGAGAAYAHSKKDESKKEAEDKLASVVDKIRAAGKVVADKAKGVGSSIATAGGRGAELLTGSKSRKLTDHAKGLSGKIQDLQGSASRKGGNMVQAVENSVIGAPTRKIDRLTKELGSATAEAGTERKKHLATLGGAAATGVAGLSAGAYSAKSKKEASAVDSFLASKLAYSAPAGEGKPPSFGSAPHVQGTVTQTGDAAPGHTGGHFTSPETFSNRSTLPGRRAEMRQYFKNPMNDQHEVPEFSHKTASATETARDLLARLAQEGK